MLTCLQCAGMPQSCPMCKLNDIRLRHGSPMMELLFARLSPALRGLAMRQLGRFLTGSCLPSVAHEAAVLANAAAWADPAGALL